MNYNIIKLEDLNNLNIDSISIIWYGSLIHNAWKYSKKYKKVLVKWYKRYYWITVFPENYCDKWFNNFKKYFDQYDLFDSEINTIRDNNICWLCLKESVNSLVNWLLYDLKKVHFNEFSLREKWYYLKKVNYSLFSEKNNYNNSAYILLPNKIYDNWYPFLPYHIKIRKKSYELSKDFWIYFDKSFN